jgi:hypothetical protein
MTKIIASISALAMAAGLAMAPQVASAQPMGPHHARCPRGSHWVPAHRDRMGRWVRGHCGRR